MSVNDDGVLSDVYEAYKTDSQDAVIARTKSLAKRYATQAFGGYDLVSKSKVRLSAIEKSTVDNDGFVLST